VDGIRHMLDFIRGKVQNSIIPVSWSVDYDVPVHIITDDRSRAGDELYLFQYTFNGLGSSLDSVTLFHEMGHVVHFHHGWPDCDYQADGSPKGHDINTEEQ